METLARVAGSGVVLDMARVTFVDGSGLRAIDRLCLDGRAKGYRVLVRNPSDFARQVLILSGFVELLADA